MDFPAVPARIGWMRLQSLALGDGARSARAGTIGQQRRACIPERFQRFLATAAHKYLHVPAAGG